MASDLTSISTVSTSALQQNVHLMNAWAPHIGNDQAKRMNWLVQFKLTKKPIDDCH
jgi:hypothetical protein